MHRHFGRTLKEQIPNLSLKSEEEVLKEVVHSPDSLLQLRNVSQKRRTVIAGTKKQGRKKN